MADYQFKLQSRRFVQDLFDKFSWDLNSISILQNCHGLELEIPMKFSTSAHTKSFAKPLSLSKTTKSEKESHPSRSFVSTYSLTNLAPSQYAPLKVRKGGF